MSTRFAMSCRASPLLAPSRRVEISEIVASSPSRNTRSPSDSPHRRSQWSSEEEDALRRGVEKYGSGKWRVIQKDAHLSKILHQRSNVDLKVRRSPATRLSLRGVPKKRMRARRRDGRARSTPRPSRAPGLASLTRDAPISFFAAG